MQFTNTVVIGRPAEEVFAFLSHFENLPLWNYAISQTWRTGREPVRVGTRFTQIRTIPTRSVETFEVTEFEPNLRLAIRGNLGPAHAQIGYRLEGVGPTTIVTNWMNLEPSGAWRFLPDMAGFRIKAAVAANLEVLKSLIEAGGGRAARRRAIGCR